MKLLRRIALCFAMCLTLGTPSQAVSPFAGYPAQCNVHEICNAETCTRAYGAGSFFLTYDDSRFYHAESMDGRWRRLGLFSEIVKSEEYLRTDDPARAFGQLLVENNWVSDAKGFYLYFVTTRAGISKSSESYAKVSCATLRGRYPRSSLQNLTCDFKELELRVTGTAEGGPVTPLTFESTMGTIRPLMVTMTDERILAWGRSPNGLHQLSVSRYGSSPSSYSVTFDNGDWPVHFLGKCGR